MKRLCACGRLVEKGEQCVCQVAARAERVKAADARRPNAAERGYDARWHKESRAYLKALGAPLCACGCGRQANMVDHKIAPKGNMTLFWDRTNWQPYNRGCNSRKNIRTEGGFGRLA